LDLSAGLSLWRGVLSKDVVMARRRCQSSRWKNGSGIVKGGEREDTLQSQYYRNASKPLREAGQEPGEGRHSDFDNDAK
jgi:hypothetical protein